MTTIAIPRDVINSMRIPRSDQEHVLKLELALALYQRGILAMGPARRLAEIAKSIIQLSLNPGEDEVEKQGWWQFWK
jgi:hypothetical protein